MTPVKDTLGNLYRQLVWANGGLGGTYAGAEAIGVFVALNVTGGENAIDFLCGGFNGNPSFDNNADLCIIAVEVSGLPVGTLPLAGAATQQGGGTGELTVPLSSGGFGLTTDFGPLSQCAAAAADIGGTAGHYIFSLLTGDAVPGSPVAPTTPPVPVPATLIDSISSTGGLPLYVYLLS